MPPERDAELPPQNLVDLLRGRAGREPERRGFSFLRDGETDEVPLTYGELERRARAIAVALRRRGLGPGERALLLYPPGLEYAAGFYGCVFAGVVAVPAYPPDPSRLAKTLPRIASIVTDAGASCVLTTKEILGYADFVFGAAPELGNLPALATDDLPPGLEAGWEDPSPAAGDLCFLQYTSGSTGDPRGVMLTHGNLLANTGLMARALGTSPEEVNAFWVPSYHDLGLIGGLVLPVFGGYPATIMSPVAFLQKPMRWMRMMSSKRATVGGGPNFAYDLCVRKSSDEERKKLDLSRWRVAVCAAEPVRAETLDRFAEAFAPAGFRREALYPCYGLAEATLLASGGAPGRLPEVRSFDPEALAARRVVPAARGEEGKRLVGCGATLPGQEIAIVDPNSGARLEEGRVGEVWLRGPSVALGYWGRPDESARVFGAELEGEGPFLRTGDLGFLERGELFVAGRLKDVLIVRGRNCYPQDIERSVEAAHPAVRPGCSAAFSVQDGATEGAGVAFEVDLARAGACLPDVLAAVREAVARHHDLSASVLLPLRPGSIPKTSSGKIQRHAARAGFEAGSLELAPGFEGAPAPRAPEPAGPAAGGRPSEADVRAFLVEALGAKLGVAEGSIDPARPFAAYGLDSATALGWAGDLEARFGVPLEPTALFAHPSVDAIARHLAGEEPSRGRASAPGAARSSAWAPAARTDAPIAVVGLACRAPGAPSLEAFWNLLVEGRDAVGELPESRRALWPSSPGRSSAARLAGAARGGFLERVEDFDDAFFGIRRREASRMDPQQRLLLETTWEALEDAGIPADGLAGSDAAVFVGISNVDYARMLLEAGPAAGAHAATGAALAIAANRISYELDLRGPSVAVDTACSSSLVAVQSACESIRSGDASLAIAAGVNLVLAPELGESLARAGFLSPSGRCRAFDAGADGYARGEGIFVAVLKPLALALADGDPVYAVILGGAVAQDGRTNGLTAPSPAAQEALVRKALARSGVRPEELAFVEAHGTGTPVGDPIEARALGAALAGRNGSTPCLLGSVKTNIGHLEAAAGLAGLTKAALALSKGLLPASLHFERPNPLVDLDALGLRVATRPTSLAAPAGGRLVAGVSSFGFGGTLAHLVLEAAPPGARSPFAVSPAAQPGAARPLLLSARREEDLAALASAYRDALARNRSEDFLEGLCHTAAERRARHPRRAALLVSSPDDALEQLSALASGRSPGASVARPDAPGAEDAAVRIARFLAGNDSPFPALPGAHARIPRQPFRRRPHWVSRQG